MAAFLLFQVTGVIDGIMVLGNLLGGFCPVWLHCPSIIPTVAVFALSWIMIMAVRRVSVIFRMIRLLWHASCIPSINSLWHSIPPFRVE